MLCLQIQSNTPNTGGWNINSEFVGVEPNSAHNTLLPPSQIYFHLSHKDVSPPGAGTWSLLAESQVPGIGPGTHTVGMQHLSVERLNSELIKGTQVLLIRSSLFGVNSLSSEVSTKLNF